MVFDLRHFDTRAVAFEFIRPEATIGEQDTKRSVSVQEG